jgi:multiple sugar transport system ATP-binding protein
MAEVRLRNVTKRFGDRNGSGGVLAVSELNLDVADGEFLVLLGPSGCGKTTTLRMVAGLERATSGEIYIGERPVNALPPGDRDIAFVFQFYALYPHLTAYDNISFPLRAQNLSKAEVAQRVQQVAQRLRIEHVLNRRPNRLPSGEQQRVALGRAMVRQPQVFLMDEPLTNLDASLRADMRVELKHLQQELGTTMLYVTHDQIEAMSMSHRIAVMNQGVLQQVDTPLNIYNHPQTLFVAKFIGSPPMNTAECRIDGLHLHGMNSRFRLLLDETFAPRLANTPEVVLGIRAEDIRLAGVGGDDADADVRGVITLREPLGDETVYRVDVEDYFVMVKTSPRQIFYPGEHVNLVFSRNRIRLFDRATGQAV